MDAAQEAVSESPAGAWRQIWRSLHELGGLLDQILEADGAGERPGQEFPAGLVARRAAELASRLKAAFADEEAGPWAEMLTEAPQYTEQLRRLQAEHAMLLQWLDEVIELTGTPQRPVASWSDVAARFRRFAAALLRHDRREAELSQRAICDDVGVGD